MKDRKIFKALKNQMISNSTTDYKYDAGLRLATLAIIQAKGLLYADAREVVNYVGFFITTKELAKWIRV